MMGYSDCMLRQKNHKNFNKNQDVIKSQVCNQVLKQSSNDFK